MRSMFREVAGAGLASYNRSCHAAYATRHRMLALHCTHKQGGHARSPAAVLPNCLCPPPASLPPCPAAASLGDAATPLGKAVRILNNQLQALSQVGWRAGWYASWQEVTASRGSSRRQAREVGVGWPAQLLTSWQSVWRLSRAPW